MPTNTYVELDKVTVSGTSTATVTFASIPSTYTDLIIVGNLGSETTNAFLYLQFNGDTASNYSYTQLYGDGSNDASSRVSNNTQLFNNDVSVKQGAVNSNVIYHIMNYSNATTYKTSLARQNTVDAADYNGTLAAVGLWRNTAAITSVAIKLTRSGTGYNFSDGSTFSLYGIAAEGVSPAAKATGGAIYSDADYYYHVFGASGTFTPKQSLTCDVVSVGGGGGGGWNNAGGGGGGEVDIVSALSVSVAKTVTIGAGGAPATSISSAGANGVTSSFAGDITSLGGGGGGTGDASAGLRVGQTGGSGGGGSLDNAGGSASGSNTNIGGTGYAVGGGNGYAGGGGGGATAVGGNGNSGTRTSGAGGQGYALSSIFTGLTLSPITHFGSGGSGGVWGESNTAFLGTAAPNGGTGGRESTNGNINPVNATANSGGGGGGGAYTGVNSRSGSNGGSGIVIVRYLKA
jgi:hypothetical protein